MNLFLTQAYAPYKSILKHYPNLVQRYLKHEFETNIKIRHPDTVECVQLLSNSVTKVFYLIEKEIDRCNKLTNGCGVWLLIEAFKVI